MHLSYIFTTVHWTVVKIYDSSPHIRHNIIFRVLISKINQTIIKEEGPTTTSMIRVGKFSRTEVENNIIFHIATLEPFSIILLLSEAAHVRSKTVTIVEELDAPSFAVNEEVNSTFLRTELGK